MIVIPDGQLLEWMTWHHLPLALWREEDEPDANMAGSWVVVDRSTNTVLGSGATASDALCAAYNNE